MLKTTIYTTANGKQPFASWLNSLDIAVQQIVLARIDRVRHGLLGDCKSVSDGVFELRIQYGAGYRVYFGMRQRVLVVLLVGGDKAGQRGDIIKAKRYWAEYKETNK